MARDYHAEIINVGPINRDQLLVLNDMRDELWRLRAETGVDDPNATKRHQNDSQAHHLLRLLDFHFRNTPTEKHGISRDFVDKVTQCVINHRQVKEGE